MIDPVAFDGHVHYDGFDVDFSHRDVDRLNARYFVDPLYQVDDGWPGDRLIYVLHHAANLHESVLFDVEDEIMASKVGRGKDGCFLAFGRSRIAAAACGNTSGASVAAASPTPRNKPRRNGRRPNQLIHKSRNRVATTCS